MKQLAVHLHIFYQDQLCSIIKRLHYLDNLKHDLFITLVEDSSEIRQKILSEFPDAKIWVVENRGYDIGPFIDFLHRINLDEYKYILKLHTKGTNSKNVACFNNKRLDNALWGKILWDSMLSSPARVHANIKELDDNPKIGMIGSAYCHTNSQKHYQNLLPQINEQLGKMGHACVDKLSFIAGSIFLSRANLLKPLRIYTLKDFDLTDGRIKEGTLAHVVERLFGALISSQNHNIHSIKHDDYRLAFLKVALKYFLFQKKITNSGKLIIKICKIPVYSKSFRGVI